MHHARLAAGRNVRVEKFDPATLPDLVIKERTAYVHGAPTSDETASDEVFGNAIYQGYGQTEVLPIAVMGPGGVVRLACVRCAAAFR